MEGSAHLLQVIRKMCSQINKLERENRALRGELQVCGQSAVLPERGATTGGGNGDVRSLTSDGEGPAGSPASLHGSIVAGPAPSPKEQTALLLSLLLRYHHDRAALPRRCSSARRSQREASPGRPEAAGQRPAASPTRRSAAAGETGLETTLANRLSNGHSSKMKLFQEHVYKRRGKVKAVSFLLPMDMSSYAENQGSLKNPQNQSTEQLTTITEKDM
ncbi:putative coiled-coil domain-containing protein 195 [Phoenicopterus ruber ruber]